MVPSDSMGIRSTILSDRGRGPGTPVVDPSSLLCPSEQLPLALCPGAPAARSVSL